MRVSLSLSRAMVVLLGISNVDVVVDECFSNLRNVVSMIVRRIESSKSAKDIRLILQGGGKHAPFVAGIYHRLFSLLNSSCYILVYYGQLSLDKCPCYKSFYYLFIACRILRRFCTGENEMQQVYHHMYCA